MSVLVPLEDVVKMVKEDMKHDNRSKAAKKGAKTKKKNKKLEADTKEGKKRKKSSKKEKPGKKKTKTASSKKNAPKTKVKRLIFIHSVCMYVLQLSSFFDFHVYYFLFFQ